MNKIKKELKNGEVVDKNMLNTYELSSDKKGLIRYFGKIDGEKNYYHIHSDEMTKEEKEIHRSLSNHSARENLAFYFKMGDDDKNDNEVKYYTWGFECPNIDNLKTKEQKDIIYNKILNQFEEQLKDWIYNSN